MSSGSPSTGLTNEINVTPMIDVLLVLLIIFMMVIPMSRKAIDLQLPDPTPDNTPPGPPPSQTVLEVLPGNVFKLNSQPARKADIGRRLKEISEPLPDSTALRQGEPPANDAEVGLAK